MNQFIQLLGETYTVLCCGEDAAGLAVLGEICK